ncbi:hypothetical protein EON63_07735 [archaeon]|nr:MAG: hypothetical protein EON63_07735 [archaeon]
MLSKARYTGNTTGESNKKREEPDGPDLGGVGCGMGLAGMLGEEGGFTSPGGFEAKLRRDGRLQVRKRTRPERSMIYYRNQIDSVGVKVL